MNESLPVVTYAEVKAFVWSLVIVQARVMPIFVLLPFMNRSLVPGMLRFAVATALGVLVVPLLAPAVLEDGLPHGLPLMALLLKESFLGLVLGYLAALPFWAFEAMGFIVDNQRGASIASTINPLTGHDSSPLGILYDQAFTVFFFVSGGFFLLAGMIYDSYALWHPLSFWPRLAEESAALLVPQLNRMVAMALLLAAPVLVAMLMAEVGLALASRFVPQLQVFFLAMPVKSGIAILMLMLYAATLFEHGRPYLQEMGRWADALDPLLRSR